MADSPDAGDKPASAALAAVAAAAPPLAVVDAGGCVTWCSQAFADAVAGVAVTELLGTEISTWLGDGGALARDGWRVADSDAGGGMRLLRLLAQDDTAALQRAIAELQERVALLQEFCNAGVFERDPVTMVGHWDDQMYRIFGLPVPPPGTLAPDYGTVASMFLREDTTPGGFRATMDRSGIHTERLWLRRPNGEMRHIHSQWKVFHDEQGRPKRVLGVNADDTEVYHLAQEAAALAQRLETAAEAARIGLWSTLVDGQSRPHWNRRMFELFGLDPAGGTLRMGDWLRLCVHPADRDRVAAQAAQWLREGHGPIELEFRVRHPGDGSVRWLVVRGHASQATPEAPRRAEGVVIDITEQQETLQRLRESVERVELTASAVGLGSWEYNHESEAGIWDEGMFRLRGRRSGRRAVTREEMAAYLHPDDRESVMDEQARRVRGGDEWRTTFRVVWPDGTVRWIASRSALVPDEGGRRVRRIGLNWDVTESVLADQAMRERELAVTESRAKSRFLSRVSHELRTPLNAVLGFTQLLRDDQAPADRSDRQRWLEHIHDAGHHLLALIDDVLDLSRVESGDLRLNLQSVALAELVASTLPLVEREAHARDVALRVESPVTGTVLADPVRLRQVLLNLLSNAIKYNRAGGQVRVSATREGAHCTLHVTDTGRGIDPAALRDAFEPFNRLGAEALGIEGTGIGLAIAKSLVEQMHGCIEARSEPGAGSAFSVTLPCGDALAASPPSAASPVAAAVEAGVAPARVLYIEDNEVNALLVREVLAPHAWVVLETASDGRSGLQRARDGRPDLVLLDMQLPDMDGIAVMQALRADPATAALRCVALSANAMPDDIETARAAGAIDYWTKPIDFADFLARLARLLGRQA